MQGKYFINFEMGATGKLHAADIVRVQQDRNLVSVQTSEQGTPVFYFRPFGGNYRGNFSGSKCSRTSTYLTKTTQISVNFSYQGATCILYGASQTL